LELVDIMQDVVQHGTGTQAKLPGIAVAGKTGTADKARDIWFVGFTPDTVTAVWGGNDNYQAVRGNVTGGTVMGKIWHDYMTDFYKSHQPQATAFSAPATPFATSATAINPSVLNDIQQYEEGVKTDPSQMQGSDQSAQPEDAEQAQDDGTEPKGTTEQMPPLAPPINRSENDGKMDRQDNSPAAPQQDAGQPVDQNINDANDQLRNDQRPSLKPQLNPELKPELRPEIRQPDSREPETRQTDIQAPRREAPAPTPYLVPAPAPARPQQQLDNF
jgi:membrane peptidoglycan carboxypeptidase